MARTSKKTEQELSAKQTLAVTEPVWKAGIYARLSVDSSDRKNESIDTQLEIAKEYIRQAKGMELVGCYTDLGKTGTNFKREGFARMMADVRQRRINCVVVKDFSRFGRNYIETGNYIEKIFPFLNVRFIAVTDGYDSEQGMGDSLQLSMNLKNIVNELYAKDIAQKVRTVKRLEQEKGSYTGGVPPYGYRVERLGDRKALFPDAATKHIVVKIFEMYANGHTRREIAEELYQGRVQRPSVYYATKEVYGKEGEALQQWSYDTIKNILTNPVYVGTLLQARTCGKLYRGRKRHAVDEEEDISVVEHTHEPLIPEGLFYRVSERFETQSKYSNQNGFSKKIPQGEDMFKDLVYCGSCGHRMARNSSIKTLASGDRVRRYYYACPNHRKIDGSGCNGQGISLGMLESLLKAVLEKEFACSKLRTEDYCRETMREAGKQKAAIRKKISESMQKQEELALAGSKRYLFYHKGELSREVFLEEKAKMAKELEALQRQGAELQQQEERVGREAEKRNQLLKRLLNWGDDAKLDRELAGCLIKQINVYPNHQVEIIFHYRKHELLDFHKKSNVQAEDFAMQAKHAAI